MFQKLNGHNYMLLFLHLDWKNWSFVYRPPGVLLGGWKFSASLESSDISRLTFEPSIQKGIWRNVATGEERISKWISSGDDLSKIRRNFNRLRLSTFSRELLRYAALSLEIFHKYKNRKTEKKSRFRKKGFCLSFPPCYSFFFYTFWHFKRQLKCLDRKNSLSDRTLEHAIFDEINRSRLA